MTTPGKTISQWVRETINQANREPPKPDTPLARDIHEIVDAVEAWRKSQRSTVPEAGKAVDRPHYMEQAIKRVGEWLTDYDNNASQDHEDGDPSDDGLAEFAREDIRLLLMAASVPAPSGTTAMECASANCGKPATRYYSKFGVGSHHCEECYQRIVDLASSPQAVPAEDVAGLIERLSETAKHSRNPAPKQLSNEFWSELANEVEEAAAALTSLSAERDVAKFDIAVQSGKTRLAEQKLTASEAEATSLRKALAKIEKWFGEFPETGEFWDKEKTRPISYGAQFGSNGERDYMRAVARKALGASE